MNDFNFTQWLAIVGPIATLTGAMFFIMRDDMNQMAKQHRQDTKISNDRWAKLDDRWAKLLENFCDLKNMTVERLVKLENGDKK